MVARDGIEPPTSLRFTSYDLAGTGIFSTLLRPMYQGVTGTSVQKVSTFEKSLVFKKISSMQPHIQLGLLGIGC